MKQIREIQEGIKILISLPIGQAGPIPPLGVIVVGQQVRSKGSYVLYCLVL